MLHAPAGPADFNPVHLLCFSESEVKRQHHLRRVTRAGLDLPHHRFPSGREPHTGADRVAVTHRPNQFQLNRIPCLLQVVHVEHRRLIVIVHDQVQPAIVVKISHRNTTPVLHTVRAGRSCNVDELPVANIRKETLVLVTVPGVFTDKFVAEEEPLFVLVNVRDRARCKRQSKIFLVLVCDPSIRRIDIEIGVVVSVEKSDTPAPTGTSGVAVFQLAKRAVAVVLEK
jgi:hypothetical protein